MTGSSLAILAIASFVLSASVIAFLLPWSSRFGFVAHPDPTVLNHVQPVPLLGGVGIIVGILLPCLLFTKPVAEPIPWSLGMAIVCVLGAFKDRVGRPVTSILQLCFQTLAITLMMLGSGSLSLTKVAWLDCIVTAVLGLCIINGVNFLDVMDGLAGGIAFFLVSGATVVLLCAGNVGACALGICTAWALAGFLHFNRHPARIFMGDIGSFGLGYILFTMISAVDHDSGHGSAIALAALPMAEVASSSTMRIFKSTSPLRGEGTHVALLLLRRGQGVWRIVLVFWSAAAACAIIAILAYYDSVMDGLNNLK